MRGPGTGTLLLTTLISIVGWLMVTLYSNSTVLSEDVHKLAIKVNTLEVISHTPPPKNREDFYILKDSINKVSEEYKEFEHIILRRLDLLDTRIDTIELRGVNEEGERVTLIYSNED